MPERVVRVRMIVIAVNVIFFLRFLDVAVVDAVEIVVSGGDDIGLVLHFLAFFIEGAHLERVGERLLAFV